MPTATLERVLQIHLAHRNTRRTHDAVRILIRQTIAALRKARAA